MGNEFDILKQVQSFDLKLMDLSQIREEGPQQIALLNQDLTTHQNSLQQELAKLEKLKKDLEKRKNLFEEESISIKKKQDRVSEIRNQKEYQASLREIEASRMEMAILKEDLKIIEDRMLEQEEICEKAQKEFENVSSEIQKKKKEIEDKYSGLDNEYSELKTQRDKLAKNVSQNVLSRYDRVRNHIRGPALLNVNSPFCPNCNMSISPQRFNELMRMDKFIACDSCQVLFYYKNDSKEQ